MYDNILFPTDGSAGADAALDHAIDHGKRYDATLHVLYVVENEPPVADAEPATVLESLEEEGEQIMQAARSRAKGAGVESIRGAVVNGTPHEQILEYTDAKDIDLIVMGTHGRGGVERYLLGSVAENVVRTADCPVLTVRRPEA